MQGSCSEIYLEESVQRAGLAPTQRLPNARILGSTSICCLTHPTITDAQIEGALHILHAILERAAR
jgi:dTDP-4-amino-4,6-dideoxygalactose transaminase